MNDADLTKLKDNWRRLFFFEIIRVNFFFFFFLNESVCVRARIASRAFFLVVGRIAGSLHGCRVLSLPKLNDDGAHGLDAGLDWTTGRQRHVKSVPCIMHACMRACLPAFEVV